MLGDISVEYININIKRILKILKSNFKLFKTISMGGYLRSFETCLKISRNTENYLLEILSNLQSIVQYFSFFYNLVF